MNSLFDKQSKLPLDVDKTLSRLKVSIEKRRGLLSPDALETYDRMKMLDRQEYRAALADKLVCELSGRLQDSWPVLYESLKLIQDYQIYKQPEWLSWQSTSRHATESFPDFESYFISRMGIPFDMFLEMEETYHFVNDHHPKWKSKTLDEANELKRSRFEKADDRKSEIIDAILVQELSYEQAAKKFEVTVRWVESVMMEYKSLRTETSNFDVSVRNDLQKQRKTQPQLAAQNGVSRYQQSKIEKIGKYADLLAATKADAKPRLSIAKAYDIAMEREGKPRNRIAPILRQFDRLSEQDKILIAEEILGRLGWKKDQSHGSQP